MSSTLLDDKTSSDTKILLDALKQEGRLTGNLTVKQEHLNEVASHQRRNAALTLYSDYSHGRGIASDPGSTRLATITVDNLVQDTSPSNGGDTVYLSHIKSEDQSYILKVTIARAGGLRTYELCREDKVTTLTSHLAKSPLLEGLFSGVTKADFDSAAAKQQSLEVRFDATGMPKHKILLDSVHFSRVDGIYLAYNRQHNVEVRIDARQKPFVECTIKKAPELTDVLNDQNLSVSGVVVNLELQTLLLAPVVPLTGLLLVSRNGKTFVNVTLSNVQHIADAQYQATLANTGQIIVLTAEKGEIYFKTTSDVLTT